MDLGILSKNLYKSENHRKSKIGKNVGVVANHNNICKKFEIVQFNPMN